MKCPHGKDPVPSLIVLMGEPNKVVIHFHVCLDGSHLIGNSSLASWQLFVLLSYCVLFSGVVFIISWGWNLLPANRALHNVTYPLRIASRPPPGRRWCFCIAIHKPCTKPIWHHQSMSHSSRLNMKLLNEVMGSNYGCAPENFYSTAISETKWQRRDFGS